MGAKGAQRKKINPSEYNTGGLFQRPKITPGSGIFGGFFFLKVPFEKSFGNQRFAPIWTQFAHMDANSSDASTAATSVQPEKAPVAAPTTPATETADSGRPLY
jgi:hypothetical protein